MKKTSLIILLVATIGFVFTFSGVYASDKGPESITMESKVFKKHKKALVTLSHKKHNEEYKIACDDCHHVYEGGKNVWKEGDKVQKCSECHKEAKAPRAKKGEPKMKKADKIKNYFYSAIHENCVACHKAEKKKGKTAPAACKDCHPKKK